MCRTTQSQDLHVLTECQGLGAGETRLGGRCCSNVDRANAIGQLRRVTSQSCGRKVA
jgi:hypothetical protein